MKQIINFVIKRKLYFGLFIGIILFTLIFYDKVYEMFRHDTENLTVILYDDTDFYDWFVQFDLLYNNKKDFSYPRYSVDKNMFLEIANSFNNDTNIKYRDGKYYFDDSYVIELDCSSRSFRYTMYVEDSAIEIMEVKLINGRYYMQLIKDKKLYKIILNKNDINKREENINDYVTIFGVNEFKW